MVNREDFPFLKNNIVYFDNAATNLTPSEVVCEIVDYYEKNPANAHRGSYDISFLVSKKLEEVREKTKNFINAEKMSEIIFTSGMTAGVNFLVQNYFNHFLKKTDEVLTTKLEHASILLPFIKLKEENKIKLNYIPLNENHELTLENLEKSITKNTKLVILSHVTNSLGDERDIIKIGEYLKTKDILFLVDAAQSIPHLRVDVKKSCIDFLVFSSHKMFGPTGVGVMYIKKEYAGDINLEYLGGGTTTKITDEDEIIYKKIPEKFEAGTQNLSNILAFGKAISYIENVGYKKIMEHESSLINYLKTELKKIPHINIINKSDLTSMILFNVEGIFPEDVAFYLNKHKICVRVGDFCAKLMHREINVKSAIRVSISIYNTFDEADKLIDLLKDKEKIIKEMLYE